MRRRTALLVKFFIPGGLLFAVAGCDALPVPEALTRAEAPVAACILPARIDTPVMERVSPEEVVAGRVVIMQLLAVTWMPETCRSGGDGQGEMACDGPNRFGWTLHGLWPNADGRPYPRYCRPATRVADATIRAHLCRTPSVDLIQHEWAAHGVCGWETPQAYFDQAAALYDALHKPDPQPLAAQDGGLTAGRLRDAFAAANPGLPREAVHVAATQDNRLREVRICHDVNFRSAACPADGRGVPDRVRLTVEPVRERPKAR